MKNLKTLVGLLEGLLFVSLIGLMPPAYAEASSADAIWPEYSDAELLIDGNLEIDSSHMEDGYILACVQYPTANRLKLRMAYGEAQLTYDLDNTGEPEIFPLQLGSGGYTFSLFENVEGSKYASGGQVYFEVTLKDEDAPFLVPNQYVNYKRESPSVEKSDELSTSSEQKKIFEEVCGFMAKEFSYDYVRAQSISPGELPLVDGCFLERTGICQDLAAVTISMLRVQGIPSRLMIGYADGYYHAWTVSLVDGEETFFDPTAAMGALDASEYIPERYY